MSATDKIKAAIWEADRHVETLAEWNRSPATSPEVRFAALMAAITQPGLWPRCTRIGEAVWAPLD